MANLKFKVGGVWNQIITIKGDKGDAGDALPVGGVAGQLLIKNSATDNDATWQNNPSAPLSHTHTIANVTGLQSALDGKVDDTQVLTNVPAGAVFTDTIYTHPTNHPASIITQDVSNRFVTDVEKTAWNAKAEGTHIHDDRYYTYVETDDLLLTKANTLHGHDMGDITGLTTTYAPLASPTFTGTPTLNGAGRMIADSSSTGTDVYFIWSGTQAQYDAIGTKDANTLYFIV